MNQDTKMNPGRVMCSQTDGATDWSDAVFREDRLSANVSDLLQDDMPLHQQVLACKNMVHSLRQLILYDPLTNLPSWKLFNQQLDVVLESAKQSSSSFAVLFFDVDRFRHVNHAFGHKPGIGCSGCFLKELLQY